jgi:ribosomal protein L37E
MYFSSPPAAPAPAKGTISLLSTGQEVVCLRAGNRPFPPGHAHRTYHVRTDPLCAQCGHQCVPQPKEPA